MPRAGATPFVDGGAFLGRDPRSGLAASPEDLVGTLDRNGVDAALVASLRALREDEEEGNREVLAAAARSGGRLLPLAVVSPLSFLPGHGGVERLARAGFRAVGLFPHYQGWSPGARVVRAIVREAAAAGLPVQLAVADWRELEAAAAAAEGAAVPVLLRWVRGGGYLYLTEAVALGRENPGLLFDVGTLTTGGGLETLCEELGAGRLYLASNYPLAYERCAYLRPFAARLSEADRAAVLGGTLARALGAAPAGASGRGSLFEDLPAPKIDVHWHEGSWGVLERGLEPAEVSAAFDRFGYRLAWVSSIRAILYDLAAGNAATAALTEAEPRCLGLVVVSPVDVPASLDEMERYLGHRRFVGLKTAADYYGTTLADPRYAPILERADALGLPVLTHKKGLAEVAGRYPRVRFVAAHSLVEDVRALAGLPNVWFELSASYAHRAETDLPGMLAAAGSRRVLFGTDAQAMEPCWSLGKVSSAGLPEAEKRGIFYENARDLVLASPYGASLAAQLVGDESAGSRGAADAEACDA